jgi:hypothetical protein
VLSGRLAALGGSVDLGAFFITDAITDAPRCIINIQYIYIYIYTVALFYTLCVEWDSTPMDPTYTQPVQPNQLLPSRVPRLPTNRICPLLVPASASGEARGARRGASARPLRRRALSPPIAFLHQPPPSPSFHYRLLTHQPDSPCPTVSASRERAEHRERRA